MNMVFKQPSSTPFLLATYHFSAHHFTVKWLLKVVSASPLIFFFTLLKIKFLSSPLHGTNWSMSTISTLLKPMDTVLSSAYLTTQQDSIKLAAFLRHSLLLAPEILHSWFSSCITDYFPVSFSGFSLNRPLTRKCSWGLIVVSLFNCLIHSLYFQCHQQAHNDQLYPCLNLFSCSNMTV